MSLYKDLIHFNTKLMTKTTIIDKIYYELASGDLIENKEYIFIRDQFILSLYLSDTTLWLPILSKYRDDICKFSFFSFEQEKAPLLQNLGFAVMGPDQLLFDIFIEFKNKERSKSNFIELQKILLENNYVIEANMNTENMPELNLIAQTWFKNG